MMKDRLTYQQLSLACGAVPPAPRGSAQLPSVIFESMHENRTLLWRQAAHRTNLVVL